MRFGVFAGGIFLGVGVLAGCGGEPVAMIDPRCAMPDLACPVDPPFAGAPCAGSLSCDYGTASGDGRFTCEGERWSGSLSCDGCAPPLAETCRDPLASPVAVIEIGPADGAFHVFTSGERVPLEWGPQGLAMVGFRVRVGGDAPPGCARVVSRVSLGDGTPSETTRAITLRCGESLGILEILPDLPCTMRPYDVHLEVEVEGAGTTRADLVIDGGGCALVMP